VYDLKLVGGTIVDGTGAPRFVGDVGVRDGVIVDVGDAPQSGRREIDATDRVVAPGFFDVHTHYDAQVVWDPMVSHSPWHGVTTVVMGSCGVGFAPCRERDRDFLMEMCSLVEGIPYDCLVEGLGDWGFETYPQYLDFLDRRGTGINLVSQIAHHPIKVWVMGPAAQDRFATADEMAQQRQLLREGLAAGAAGFSIFNNVCHWGPGGKPVPSRLTTRAEYHSLLQVIADHGTGGVDLNTGRMFNVNTIAEMATTYPISFPRSSASRSHELAAEIVERGGLVYPQIGVFAPTFEVGLEDPFMFAIDQAIQRCKPLHELFGPLTEMTRDERLAEYQRPGFRERFVADTDRDDWNGNYWPTLLIGYAPSRPDLEGRYLADVAHEMGIAPASLMLDLSLESDLQAGFLVEMPLDPSRIDRLRTSPDYFRLGGSDGGAHQGQIADYRFPTHFLGRHVRERGFPLERAVQLLTSQSADLYGVVDRGSLTPGLAADVVVFDPETVIDGPLTRVNDLPGGARRLFSDGIGIDHVIVNGEPVRRHGETVVEPDALPGRVIRNFRPNADRHVA
jgi:N-acyl-D-aspartate/D-glutamate deacylase